MIRDYKIDDYSLRCEIKTHWRDLDAFQHINNAVYATYIETARVELFKRWNIKGSNSGKSIIMASLKINYFKQVKHPSILTVCQKITRIGTKSFDIESVVFDTYGKAVCDAVVVAVCYDFDAQRSVDVYSSIKNDLNR